MAWLSNRPESNYEKNHLDKTSNKTKKELEWILSNKKGSEQKENNEKTKNTLNLLQKEIKEQHNETLILVNKFIRYVLREKINSWEKFSFEDHIQVEDFQYQLMWPAYKENEKAQSYLKVLNVLALKNWSENIPEEIRIWVEEVIYDKNIPPIIKKNLIIWLKENDFHLDWEELVNTTNKLIKNLIKNWHKQYANEIGKLFQATADGSWTNLFSNQQG